MTIKTFRGKIAHGGQDTIVLHTNNGSTGYRIVKFQVMNPEAGAAASETQSTVKIYKTEQTTIDSKVDFSENILLGAAQLGTQDAFDVYPQSTVVIFDREIFNQDIYVTHNNYHADATATNYYIELEQVKLDLSENTVATLKDLRNETLVI